jgi:hypothetical protein
MNNVQVHTDPAPDRFSVLKGQQRALVPRAFQPPLAGDVYPAEPKAWTPCPDSLTCLYRPLSQSSLNTPNITQSTYSPHLRTCRGNTPSFFSPSFSITRPDAGFVAK